VGVVDRPDGGLETERLRLSPWQPEDWLDLRPIATDPETMRYISEGRPWPDERIQEFVGRQITGYAARRFCMWKTTLKAADALIGFCGLQPLAATEEIEIGWWVARAHWGRGLATEAAREALRDAFERLRLLRVVAIAQPANQASIRIMKKLGMRYERDFVHRDIPVVLYAIDNPRQKM
jgi:RimJ/RimL family protein N-acetyltransferase